MFWRPRGWCCDRLKEHFERRYDRGLFVFATPLNADGFLHLTFWVGMRCVRMQDMDKLPELIGPPGIPMTILTWYPICYCPWCGVKLEQHYGDQFDLLVDPIICEEHRLK